MKNLIIQDEKSLCSSVLEKPFRILRKDKKIRNFKDAYFIGDDNFLCDYFFDAVTTQNKKQGLFEKVTYVCSGFESGNRERAIRSNTSIFVQDLLAVKKGSSAVFFFADCVGGIGNKKKSISLLKKVFTFMKNKFT